MGTEAAFGQYADYPILRHISKVLIVLSECNLVPVAGITLALAWTLDLQINSDGKSGKTGNNLFSNKPLGSQLIATVSPVTGTGNHLKHRAPCTSAETCSTTHLTSYLLPQSTSPFLGIRTGLFSLDKLDLKNPVFCSCRLCSCEPLS